jgi:nucleoid-associated protein EbfC
VFKGLSNLGAILKQAQEFGGRMKGLNEELRSRHVTGSAGGGMVEVEVNGLIEVSRCHVDPQLLAQGDRELLEDLVVAAVNQAVAKARELHAEAVRSMTGGMDIPGLDQALGKFLGDRPPEAT